MALCRITVDGQDVTGVVDPYLLSLSVSDRAGKESATAQIELADRDGQILLPRRGATLTAALGQGLADLGIVFTGKVDEVRSRGGRGGRTLTVSAKEIDAGGKVKQTQSRHFDDKTVKDILTEAGKAAGVADIRVDEALAAITLPYAAMMNESFIAFGQRLARELGATFKVTDSRATLTARNGGGMPFPTIIAAWGDNLIEWDVAPILGRPRFARTKSRWHDPKTGKTEETEAETDLDGADAEATETFSAPDAASAKRRAGSAKAESERESGGGTVRIVGDATIQPEARLQLVGTRVGVDGTYVIDGLTHEYSRAGFTTSCELKRPTGAAGKDSRGDKPAS